jgi:serine/threonine-protein kinase RsbW
MATDALPLTLTLPSDLRILTVARAFMEAVCQAGRLNQASTNGIVIAVHEAISNVIRHAHRNNPNAQLHIHCQLGPDRIEIQVIDEGEPFDLSAVPQLDPTELRLGGRGVFLMRALMDELSCRPCGERGNVLRMVKFWGDDARLGDCG